MTDNAGGGAGAGAGNGTGGAGAGAGGDAAGKTGGAFAGQAVVVQGDAATGAGASVAADVNLMDKNKVAGDAAGAAPDFKAQLGDFAKDPAFANFADAQSMAKALKESQALVGKKLGIPGAESTPEEKAAFYKALGVPDAPEGYGLKKPEGLPPALDKMYDDQMLGGFQKLAREQNLTPAQAQGIQKWYDGMTTETLKGLQDDIAKSDTAYAAEAVKLFGTQEKAEQVQMAARTAMEKFVPEGLRASLADLPNNALLAMAAMFSGLTGATGGEDKTMGVAGADGKHTGKTVSQLREEGQKKMADPAYNNVFASNHKELRAEVQDLYAQIGRIEQAGKAGGARK